MSRASPTRWQRSADSGRSSSCASSSRISLAPELADFLSPEGPRWTFLLRLAGTEPRDGHGRRQVHGTPGGPGAAHGALRGGGAHHRRTHHDDLCEGAGFATIQRFREPVPREDEPRLCGLFFDFDDAASPDRALREADRLIHWFAEIGLPWSAYRIEFSGNRGAHVSIEPGVFGIVPRPDLVAIVKAAVLWLADRLELATLDRLVYGARRQWRLADTLHLTSGLYCVEIGPQDLARGIGHVRALARAVRGPLYRDDDRHREEHPELAAWFRGFVEEHERQVRSAPGPPESIEETALSESHLGEVVALLRPYYVEGRRHYFTLALSGFLTRRGVPEGQVKRVVEHLAARDPEKQDRVATVRSAARRRASGKRIAGRAALARFVPEAALGRLEALLARPCAEFKHPEAPRVVRPDEAEAVLLREVRAGLDAPDGTITVIAAATGAGKTTATIRVAGDHDRPIAFFAREHELLEEVEGRAAEAGVNVRKWPRLDDDTCPEARSEEISALYERGFDGTAAICVACPQFPANGGSCPRMLAMKEIDGARLRLIPVANLRPSGPRLRSELEARERYARGAAIVFDEDPTADLTRPLVVTRKRLELFSALLDEAIEGGRERKQGVTLEVFTLSKRVREALAAFEAILASEPPPAGESRVIDLATKPCPGLDLDGAEMPSTVVKLDRLLALTALESTLAAGATNLLPVALRAAYQAHLGRPLLALRREDRLELEVAPRPEPEVSMTILDATASPDLLRAAFPGFQVVVSDPIALVRPATARLIQYVDRSFSRESVKDEAAIADAARVVAAAIRLHVRDPERPTLGLVTYKHVVQPLARAILAEVEDVQLAGSLHFGGLRGKNALEGVDVLVVLGTPRPNPAAIEVRAIGLAEEEGGRCDSSRGESGVEVLAYGGRRVRRYRGSKEGAFAIAEEHAISAELLQAIGRQRLERHGGVTLLFSSWPLPLSKGAVEIRSAREDGLVTDRRRAAAYEAFEGKLLPALTAAPAGLTSKEAAAVAGIDQRHLCRYLETFLRRNPGFSIDRSTYPARLKAMQQAGAQEVSELHPNAYGAR